MKKNKLLFLIAVIIFVAMILNACKNDFIPNMSESMEDFNFMTQNEESLKLDDLKGEWWITYLSYTHCRTVCPRTTANMVNVQSTLNDKDLHPHIVSFSVDPNNDDPQSLLKYAKQYGVDLNSWDFLTGYDFDVIQNVSKNSFHAVLESGAAGQVSHSYMFYLVNPDGKVVKKYDGMDNNNLEEMVKDVEKVFN